MYVSQLLSGQPLNRVRGGGRHYGDFFPKVAGNVRFRKFRFFVWFVHGFKKINKPDSPLYRGQAKVLGNRANSVTLAWHVRNFTNA